MELRLVRGPLPEPELRAAAELYGSYRPKYADVDYCRALFNGNPFGYSLHAFLVLEDGRFVGTYSIIPTSITVRGERRFAGKAEALIVLPGHRRETVLLDGATPVLCGLAMPARLYRFALEQGMDLVHMIPSPDVQVIYPVTGCRAVEGRHRRARMFVRARAAASPGPLLRRGAQVALAAGQRAAFGLARATTFTPAGRIRRWSGASLTPDLLARIAADARSPDRWTLEVDPPLLAWLARAAHLEVVALDEAMENYAVVCGRAGEGRVLEVLFWRQRSGGIRSALRLLGAIVDDARGLDDVIVGVSETAAWSGEERERLRAAARRLVFHERAQSSNIFVYTRDRWFLDPGNLRFTPFFYGMF